MKDKKEWVSLIKKRSEEGRIYVECAKGIICCVKNNMWRYSKT